MMVLSQLAVLPFHVVGGDASQVQPATSVYLEIFKVIGGGLFVALLTLYVQRQHYKFDRLKESRRAYSEAKTGVDYLELRLASLKRAEAAALLQQTHVTKHMAELYPEIETYLRHRGITKDTAAWGDQLYYRLSAARKILEQRAEEWDDMGPAQRFQILKSNLNRMAAAELREDLQHEARRQHN